MQRFHQLPGMCSIRACYSKKTANCSGMPALRLAHLPAEFRRGAENGCISSSRPQTNPTHSTFFFHTPFCAGLFQSPGGRFLSHGPVLGPGGQRSGSRLTESAGASASTSSKAGTRLCAGPGTARARPSAVRPMACCTAVESTLHHRLAQLLGRDRARPAGPGRSAARLGAAQARSLRRSTVRQSRIRASKGTERLLVRARGGWRVYDALPHATRPHPEQGPQHTGYHRDEAATPAWHRNRWPSQRRRPINHKVEPAAVI